MANELDTSVAAKCEWNPYDNEAAVFDGWRHIGCPNDATVCIGANGQWHLCESCAALSRFKRLKKTPLENARAKGLLK